MSTSDNDESFEITENKKIIDDHIEWSKNIPFLYDQMQTQVLEYSSSSVKWLETNIKTDYDRIILTSKSENYNKSTDNPNKDIILIARVYELKNYQNILNGSTEGEKTFNTNSTWSSNPLEMNYGNKWFKIESKTILDQTCYKMYAFNISEDFFNGNFISILKTDNLNSSTVINKETKYNNNRMVVEESNSVCCHNIIFTVMTNNEIYIYLDYSINESGNNIEFGLKYISKLYIPFINSNSKVKINHLCYNNLSKKVSISCSNNYIYLFNLENISCENTKVSSYSELNNPYRVNLQKCFESENDLENRIEPYSSIMSHKRQVNCSGFSKHLPSILFSCSDDRCISM